jgi:hypothetical protein
MSPTYVYGLVGADTELPADLAGLGPSGKVSTIRHERLAAIVSDVPTDRPLGTRADLVAHETVVDTVAIGTAVLPMRFPAVVEEEAVVGELLEPNQDRFLEILSELDGLVQFTVKGRYEQENVLREVLDADPGLRELRDRVQEMPEDASYYERVRLGELIVGALESMREEDGDRVLDALSPLATDVSLRDLGEPDEVVNAAFLVRRDAMQGFEDAVEGVGEQWHGRVRFRLLGPVAPYDFVPAE